jgi:hypothetical protein
MGEASVKQFITLPEMYGDLQARRIGKFGRVELLRIINDGAPYWFVRVTGFDETRDRPRLENCGSRFGNGYWRFLYLDEAQAKFKELTGQPESLKEEERASELRRKNSERMKRLLREGKFKPFEKIPSKT